MLFYKRVTGAKTIGFAGQLGPIIEKQLKTTLKDPFYVSTFGNIWSIHSAVRYIIKAKSIKSWETKVAIIGSGELAHKIAKQLKEEHYPIQIVDVTLTRRGEVKLKEPAIAKRQLSESKITINLLPRGRDFLSCSLHELLPEKSDVIDFSRPQLQPGDLPQRLYPGNRVVSSGLHFKVALPGGWKSHEIPACSMPCIISALLQKSFRNIKDFNAAAIQTGFQTSLAGNLDRVHMNPIKNRIPIKIPTA